MNIDTLIDRYNQQRARVEAEERKQSDLLDKIANIIMEDPTRSKRATLVQVRKTKVRSYQRVAYSFVRVK